MRWWYIPLFVVCLVGFSGCKDFFPAQADPTPEQRFDSYINISDAVVMQFFTESPRSIILDKTAEGTSQVWFDEEPGEIGFIVNTQFYSIDGCPLPGPPLVPGDTVKVAGHLDDESRLVADYIWILNNEVGDEECPGSPAELPVIVVP